MWQRVESGQFQIPDNDSSSFLLRVQPVQFNVVGIHRDKRSHSLSYKKYAAYFDEPLAHVESKRRTCYLRYYPNDRRTAAINVMKYDIKEFDRCLCNKSCITRVVERAFGRDQSALVVLYIPRFLRAHCWIQMTSIVSRDLERHRILSIACHFSRNQMWNFPAKSLSSRMLHL